MIAVLGVERFEEARGDAVVATGRLGAHRPEEAQWERCMGGLLADGLLVRHDDGALAFPG